MRYRYINGWSHMAASDAPPLFMSFQHLATELLVFIFELHLDDDAYHRAELMFPADRLAEYIERRRDQDEMRSPLCLTDSTPEERALSGQAVTCAETHRHELPRIFQLCHISSSIRAKLMAAAHLWAARALCWPAQNKEVIARASLCPLSLVSPLGLCACIFSDIKPFLHRAAHIQLTLPSKYIRTDGAELLTSRLFRDGLDQGFQLTDLELRFDGHAGAETASLNPSLLLLPCLRRARVQNADFVPVGPCLRVLHLATEPRGPALSFAQFLAAVQQCPNLRELAVQNTVRGDYAIPWDVGSPLTTRLALKELEHLTCSGSRGLARAFMYWIEVPSTIDFQLDADFRMGTTPRPFDVFPSEIAAELYVLLHPAETAATLEYARVLAEEDAIAAQSTPPDVPKLLLPYLALNIILDAETLNPLEMWPRLITVALSEDLEGARRSVLPGSDPIAFGVGHMRRTFTMRNFYASFPNDRMVAVRESLPRHLRPANLGQAAALLLEAYVRQADAEEDVIHLEFGPSSWVPRDEDEWLFVLADLPQLRVIKVPSIANAYAVKALARQLRRDRGNVNLTQVTFTNTGLGRDEARGLQNEVDEITMKRENEDEEEELPHIVWSLG